MMFPAQKGLFVLLLTLLTAIGSITLPGCSHSRQTTRGEQNQREREEDEEEEFGRPAPPAVWGGGIVVEPIEGARDTVTFHIGSPLFLRMTIQGDRGCEPFNGTPFFFDANG